MIVAICLLPALAFSSGGSFNAPSNEANYDIGKKVFQEKVICSSCLHADLDLNANSVASILPDLNRKGVIGSQLTLRERKSVKLFVKRRFNI